MTEKKPLFKTPYDIKDVSVLFAIVAFFLIIAAIYGNNLFGEFQEKVNLAKILFAICTFNSVPSCCIACIFTHGWVGRDRIHIRHLLPKLSLGFAHNVHSVVIFCDVKPLQASTLRAIQLFQSFITKNQNGICIDDESSFIG